MIYPWQRLVWHRLYKSYSENRLAHAILISGASGIGKFEFATHLAKFVLCDNPIVKSVDEQIAQPCNDCASCQLFDAGTHPDIKLVLPEEEGKAIPIDAIRLVGDFLALKSQRAKLQVVIVSPAESMNRFSANSLLKTLEEPTPESLIIVLSSQPRKLLPTVRSRCQQMPIPTPSSADALLWLEQALQHQGKTYSQGELVRLLDLSAGAPLKALQFGLQNRLEEHDKLMKSLIKIIAGEENPLNQSDDWLKAGKLNTLNWLYLWISRMIKLKSAPQRDDSFFEDAHVEFIRIVDSIGVGQLFVMLDKIVDALRLSQSQINEQLMMEDLLIQCSKLRTKSEYNVGVL